MDLEYTNPRMKASGNSFGIAKGANSWEELAFPGVSIMGLFNYLNILIAGVVLILK